MGKSHLIDRLKEQNLQMSDDLAKYSEEIKIQIKTLQNEKENCEARSKESEQEYTSQLEQQKENINRILQEGKTMEEQLNNKYKMLEKEKYEKVRIMENNRDQLVENLKKERSEKNSLSDQKVKLERKIEENDKIKKLEETIVELKDEKGIIESRCKEISKDLEQLKLRVPDSTDIDSEH